MQHKTIIVLLIVIFAISISQRESFAPVIPQDNTSSSINNQTKTSGTITSQNNLWYIAIIIGVIIGVILTYFTMIQNRKSS